MLRENAMPGSHATTILESTTSKRQANAITLSARFGRGGNSRNSWGRARNANGPPGSLRAGLIIRPGREDKASRTPGSAPVFCCVASSDRWRKG